MLGVQNGEGSDIRVFGAELELWIAVGWISEELQSG